MFKPFSCHKILLKCARNLLKLTRRSAVGETVRNTGGSHNLHFNASNLQFYSPIRSVHAQGGHVNCAYSHLESEP
jgi:hypothetical protein